MAGYERGALVPSCDADPREGSFCGIVFASHFAFRQRSTFASSKTRTAIRMTGGCFYGFVNCFFGIGPFDSGMLAQTPAAGLFFGDSAED